MNYTTCIVLNVTDGRNWTGRHKRIQVKCGGANPEDFELADDNRCEDSSTGVGMECHYDGTYFEITDKFFSRVISEIGLKNIKKAVKQIRVEVKS